ncbi:hypothetical protein [Paenibacillus sp. KN14-4R]|uniref:hypothetical protein n=1 Tax=Paenibacillus sp. KN14-4R TaxID=3445773 RepID=UPI003FA18DF7
MDRRWIRISIILLCLLLSTAACSSNKKVISEADTKQLSQIRTNMGSILYGTDQNSIQLLLNLSLAQVEGVKITFENVSPFGPSLMLGEGNSLLSLGTITDEIIIHPVNNGLRLWSQNPIRFLNYGKIMLLTIIDASTNEVLLKEQLTF